MCVLYTIHIRRLYLTYRIACLSKIMFDDFMWERFYFVFKNSQLFISNTNSKLNLKKCKNIVTICSMLTIKLKTICKYIAVNNQYSIIFIMKKVAR